MRTRLTKRRLWAIENGLTLYLAGEIDSDHPGRLDYELALRWVREEQEARSPVNKQLTPTPARE